MSTITRDGLLVPGNRLDDLEFCCRYLAELGCECGPEATGCVTCKAARLHRELFPDGPVPDGTPLPDMTPAEALVLLADAVEDGVSDLTRGSYAEARRFQALQTVRDLVPRAEAAPVFSF